MAFFFVGVSRSFKTSSEEQGMEIWTRCWCPFNEIADFCYWVRCNSVLVIHLAFAYSRKGIAQMVDGGFFVMLWPDNFDDVKTACALKQTV